MAETPDPKNSSIVGKESLFNKKATFYGGIEVFGDAIVGETGEKLGSGTGGEGSGSQGVQGALSNFQGTQGVINDLQGSQGNQGPQGTQGLQGVGSQGVQGPLSNFQGTQGNQGLQGTQGLQGPLSNFQGTQGVQGLQGPQGVQNAQGTQGVQGLQGAQGVQNAQGSQGTQGQTGSQGNQGVQNAQGNQGLQGTQGLQGPLNDLQGTQGSQGVQNSQGTQGSQGVQNSQGLQGPQGVQNSQGSQGLQGGGNQGAQGTQGLQGALNDNQGTQGAQGTQGRQGVQGPLSDHQGTQGAQGVQNSQGLQGLQGIIGPGSEIFLDDNNDLAEITFIGLSTISQINSPGITTINVSSDKLVFLPSTGSLGIGTSTLSKVGIDTVALTVSGIATADSYYGDGVNLVGIVTQLVSGIGVDLDPVNGKGKVTITSYKPIGKTIFVSQTGNDSNTGLSENHPKKTIKNAVGIASTGDTVKVYPGVYVENNPIVLGTQVSVEGTELRNCIVTPQNTGLDLFHVNNGCHVTDLSFIGSESTSGAAMVAFSPLAGVSSDRFFDGARMLRMNLDFISKESSAREQLTGEVNGITYEDRLTKIIKDAYKAVCFDITRGGNAKCVGIGSGYYVDPIIDGAFKVNAIRALDYSVGIATHCINNITWTPSAVYQTDFYQIKDASIQIDGTYSNYDLGSCSNVNSAVHTCVGIITQIADQGYESAGITENDPTAYDGQSSNNFSSTKIGGNTYSAGVGNITQGPYIRNCTNFIGKSIGMRVDGFHAEPGDQDDIGITGSMSVDSYTQYNQNGIGVSITNGAYAQLVSIFTICNDIGHWNSGGGQSDITNSNCSFGNRGLISNGVGDEYSRSIYRYTGEVVTEVDSNGDNPDTIEVSGVGNIRPYDGQAIYFDKLYNEVQSTSIINGGSGYDANNPPAINISSPSGPNGITAEITANVDISGKISSIDVINTGSQYLENPAYEIVQQNGGTGLAFTTNLYPIYYGVESATLPISGITTITLLENLNNTVSTGSTVYFSRLSLQLATTISLEWVGSGTNINSARPGIGGVAIPNNEFVMQNGGKIIFTGTNQAGDFKIGPDVTINQLTGTISGRAFSQSLLNTVTPLIIALA